MRKFIKQFINWRCELVVGLILILVIVLGIELRSYTGYSSIYTNNVASYYFHRSNYLNENGNLPPKDVWGFAPDSASENIPPFLAFLSVFLYKILNITGLWNSFYDFALIFPIMIFVIWSLGGFLIFVNLFKNYYHGLTFAFILAIVPASILLMQKGFYTEEALGAFLIFLSLYFLIKSAEKKIFLVYLSLSLLALALTWQQFPIFHAALIAYIGVYFLFSKVEIKQIYLYILAIALPIIAGHFISRNLVGIDYSPILMIKELAAGLINYNSEIIKIAMSRSDWRHLNWSLFVKNFGFLFGILTVAGLIKLAAVRTEKVKRIALIIFGFAAFAMAFMFLKARYFALPIVLFIALEGFDGILNLRKIDLAFYQRKKDLLKKWWRFAVSRLKNADKKKTVIAAFLVFAAFLCVLITRMTADKSLPKPEVIFNEPSNIEVDKTAQIEIILKNSGGPSWDNKYVFSGLHMEVENAIVSNIRIESKGTNEVVIKKDAQRGTIFWFEVKMTPMASNQSGKVLFDITPTAKRVNVYYRAWLPGYCSIKQQKLALEDLRASWQSIEKGGWRNEECIKRLPENNSQEIICPVLVYAGHKDLQNFRCFKKEFLVK